MQVKTIAFYHYTFPAGGAEVVTCNLGRFFAKHGFRILLYTWKPNAELLTEELRKIFDIRPLPDTKRISGARNTDFLCESLKTERADVLFIQATTDIAFEQIRTRTTAKIIFCLHNTPFWEVYDLKHKKSSEIPRPILTRRLEYALLRKPAYRLTRKLEQRYAQLYIRVLSNVDRFVTLCPGYSDEFEREIRRSGLPGCNFPRERLTAMLNPMLPTQAQREDRSLRRTIPAMSQTHRPAAENMEAHRAAKSRMAAGDRRRRRRTRRSGEAGPQVEIAAD